MGAKRLEIRLSIPGVFNWIGIWTANKPVHSFDLIFIQPVVYNMSTIESSIIVHKSENDNCRSIWNDKRIKNLAKVGIVDCSPFSINVKIRVTTSVDFCPNYQAATFILRLLPNKLWVIIQIHAISEHVDCLVPNRIRPRQ